MTNDERPYHRNRVTGERVSSGDRFGRASIVMVAQKRTQQRQRYTESRVTRFFQYQELGRIESLKLNHSILLLEYRVLENSKCQLTS